MSNTRNTPVEVLELECPLRVRAYALRRGSGGVGKWVGGEGVIREFEALAPMELSVLAERRRHATRGVAGGASGAPGRTLLNAAPVGVGGALEELRRGQMSITCAAILAGGLLVGPLLGAKLAGTLPAVALRRAFGGSLLLVSVKFLLW